MREARSQRREKMLNADFAGRGRNQEQLLSEGGGQQEMVSHSLLRGRQFY